MIYDRKFPILQYGTAPPHLARTDRGAVVATDSVPIVALLVALHLPIAADRFADIPRKGGDGR